MNISRTEFAEILERISEHLKSLAVDIQIEDDYYWIVLPPDWTKFSSEEPSVAVGSFLDDWETMRRLRDGDQPVSFVDYDRAAALLRYISERYLHD